MIINKNINIIYIYIYIYMSAHAYIIWSRTSRRPEELRQSHVPNSSHRRSVELSMIQASCLQMGGRAPPQFSKPHQLALNIMLPANRYTEIIWILSATSGLQLVGGGAARPPNPQLSFYTVHGLLSITWRHQEELCQSHNLKTEVCQVATSIIQAFCHEDGRGGPRYVVPRKPISNIILPTKAEPICTFNAHDAGVHWGLQMGGAAHPQPPSFLFRPCIACCQDMDPVRTRNAYVHWVCKLGGRPPNPPAFLFVPCMACCQEHRS